MTAWFDLEDEKERSRALAYLAKGLLNPRRNNEQNRMFHALLGDIAKQVTWAGKRWDIDEWKRLITAAWMRTRSQSFAMVPAIDGHGFDVLYQRTSKLSVAEFTELIEFTTAWAIDQGVVVREPEAA